MKASHVNDTKLITLPDGAYKNVKARVLISLATAPMIWF